MSRYTELIEEMHKIGPEANNVYENIDPSHALQRVAALERVVASQIWLIAQTLKELQRRDGALAAKERT